MISLMNDAQTKLAEMAEQGIWTEVTHYQMKELWRKSFTSNEAVSWDTFWEVGESRNVGAWLTC